MRQRLRLRLLCLGLTFSLTVGRSYRPDTVLGWILFNHPTALYDPPYCATNVAAAIMDIVRCAQMVVAMTGDCMGDLEEPSNCAADIFGFLSNVADLGDSLANLAMSCAGEETTCEDATFSASEDCMNVGSDLIGAAQNCDIDVFLCTINVVDAASDMLTMATDIRAATPLCPRQRESIFRRWLEQEHPDWFQYRLLDLSASDKNSSLEPMSHPQISSLYRSVINGESLDTYKRTPTRLGLIDMTHSGAILAIDAPGIVRVGSAYVLPSDNALFKTDEKGRRLSEHGARRIDKLHDTEVEVFRYSHLERSHGGWPEDLRAFE